MKNTFLKLLMTLAVIAALAACKKETTNNDAAEFDAGLQTLADTYAPAKKTATISSGTSNTIIGANTRLYFYANAFITASGAPVTGNVQIEFRELHKKAHMVLANKTTVSNEGLLDSRGEVYIKVTQNGQQLRVRSGYSYISFNAKSYTEPMDFYMGTTSTTTDLSDITWQKSAIINPTNGVFDCSMDSMNPPIYLDTVSNPSICDTLYTFPLDSLGWINCDRFNSYPDITDISINAPAGYDQTNTVVYIIFKSMNAVTKTHAYANGVFTLGGSYKVPVGMQATIVALGYYNGQWSSSFHTATITSGMVETLNFQPTTLQDYTNDLNAL